MSLDEFFCPSDLSNHELSTSNSLQVHEGAVYLRQGKTYLVKDLDLSRKIAWCKEADLKYYTKTRDYTDVQVIGGDVVHNLFLVLIPTSLSESFSPFWPVLMALLMSQILFCFGYVFLDIILLYFLVIYWRNLSFLKHLCLNLIVSDMLNNCTSHSV